MGRPEGEISSKTSTVGRPSDKDKIPPLGCLALPWVANLGNINGFDIIRKEPSWHNKWEYIKQIYNVIWSVCMLIGSILVVSALPPSPVSLADVFMNIKPPWAPVAFQNNKRGDYEADWWYWWSTYLCNISETSIWKPRTRICLRIHKNTVIFYLF